MEDDPKKEEFWENYSRNIKLVYEEESGHEKNWIIKISNHKSGELQAQELH